MPLPTATDADARANALLVLRLHRDVRWLQLQLGRISRATALDAGQLRAIAVAVLKESKKRSKRTLAR